MQWKALLSASDWTSAQQPEAGCGGSYPTDNMERQLGSSVHLQFLLHLYTSSSFSFGQIDIDHKRSSVLVYIFVR
jgi:hypothetical protein